jgi:hypothetical protein
MAVLGLVLPSFTVSSPGPTLSPLQSTFLILMSVGLYGVFLGIQTRRHRDYFVSMSAATVMASGPGMEKHGGLALRSVKYHGLLLLAYVLPIVLLAKQIAVPIDYGISVLGAPAALGGLLVAVLILWPESLSAGRAAWANQLQRYQSGAGNRALEHQLDDPSGSPHRTRDRQNHHPRSRYQRYGLAAVDADGKHADLRPGTNQRSPGRRAFAPISRLSDASLRKVRCACRGASN